MTKVLKAVMPAAYLTAFVVVAFFVLGFARQSVATAILANPYIIGVPVTLVIGLWAGVLVRRAKGTLADAFTGGLAVGLLHGVLAIVLFGYVAGGTIGTLLDISIVFVMVSIIAAVAGAGIIGGK